MTTDVIVTDYNYLLKGKLELKLPYDTKFKEIKELYFNHIITNNIINNENEYIKYLLNKGIVGDEEYFRNNFRVVCFGNTMDLDKMICNCVGSGSLAIVISF